MKPQFWHKNHLCRLTDGGSNVVHDCEQQKAPVWGLFVARVTADENLEVCTPLLRSGRGVCDRSDYNGGSPIVQKIVTESILIKEIEWFSALLLFLI